MKDIILYTKSDCHLCDDAYQLVLELINDIPLSINFVDISHPRNKQLRKKYGLRIPVLAQPNYSTELEWPFSVNDLRAYLSD